MKFSILKKIRVVVSVVFLILTTLLFVDIKNLIPPTWFKSILFFQFIPSVLNYINIFSVTATGFFLVISLTLLFGRIYCSSICPLGTIQDIISNLSGRIAKRYKKKSRYAFSKPYNALKYSILIIAIISFIAGTSVVINLTDPFSVFGKIANAVFKPLMIWSNNLISFVLMKFDNYSLYPYEYKGINFLTVLVALSVLISLIILSVRRGRLYCNTICPVGTLLGFLSRFSFFKIVIDENNCKDCGVCEWKCKSECIDTKNHEVDVSRCVACFNCLTVCPSNGVTIKRVTNYRKQTNPEGFKVSDKNYKTDLNKRNFILRITNFVFGLTIISSAQQKIKVYVQNKIPVIRKNPVAPPGSVNIEHFNSICTACHLCIDVCPTQVLEPAFNEYGLMGVFQPRMNYIKSFCNYECKLCTEVCPTGAIKPIELQSKKLIQLGKAKFIKDNCVVYTQGTECGACSEHCPTKAVSMVPYKNLLSPEVKEEFCIGCGACEYACPTKPYKAIYVEGNRIHQTARKNVLKKKEEKINYQEDFPF